MHRLKTIPLLITLTGMLLHAEQRVLISNEIYSGFGDFSSVWQSFTVKESITISQVDLYVRAVNIGEDFAISISEYDPWEGTAGTSSESITVTKESFNTAATGAWVSASWDTPIALDADKIYRINIQSQNQTSGYNEYAYLNASVLEAARMSGGNGDPYGHELTFRLWGTGTEAAIGPYLPPTPDLLNLRFVRYSFGDPYFYFDFESDQRFAYLLYSSYDLVDWRLFHESYHNRGTGDTITQHAGTLRTPNKFIRLEVVNLADTQSKKL